MTLSTEPSQVIKAAEAVEGDRCLVVNGGKEQAEVLIDAIREIQEVEAVLDGRAAAMFCTYATLVWAG